MSRSGLWHFVSFFIYLLVQVVLMKNLVLFDTGFCFVYVAYLLFLPIETNPLVLMGVGFGLGFMVDVFYDSLGLHASTMVFIGYIRNYWLARITPQGGYEGGSDPTLAMNGLQWFIVYTFPLIFLHHLALFFLEAWSFHLLGYTLLKVFVSTIFTFTIILLFQYLRPERRRL